jgi:hypothetical protein
MKRVDTTELADVIARCFELSMDGRLSRPQRSALLAAGKRLRGDLVTLLTSQFDDGTAEVDAANADLASVNQSLEASAADLDKLDGTLQQIRDAVAKIDELIPLIARAL